MKKNCENSNVVLGLDVDAKTSWVYALDITSGSIEFDGRWQIKNIHGVNSSAVLKTVRSGRVTKLA